ncbi:MAG: hypothetical protein OEY01_12755 [Desulfobulbaceae bacterium]|nr:hypothetical protein [Desulfobulbaceae bacterium]
MRQFLLDELSDDEINNLESYLKRTLKQAPMEGVFWLTVPDDLWAEAQQGHDDCGPFYFGIELDRNLGRNKFIAEFLVRSESNLHCTCISYATSAQRGFLLNFIDTMLAEEHIKA